MQIREVSWLKIKSAILILLAALLLCSCGAPKKPEQSEKYTAQYYDAFDTTVTLIGYCSSEEEFSRYSEYAGKRLAELHRLFDIYAAYPGMNNAKTINDNAGGSPVAVAEELYELLDFSVRLHELTGGHMNIAMGSVLKQWHAVRELSRVFPEAVRLPEHRALLSAAEHCDISCIILDPTERTVRLADSEMSIDMGAVAKGYAVEKLVCELRDMGWQSFAVNAGGNVRTGEAKPDGSAWRVAIRDPDTSKGENYIAAVYRNNSAVVTSGVYERSFFYEGKRYHHIIDGKTLMPEERYLSVTVIGSDSALADALSTALFNMELEQGRELAEGLEGIEVLWALPDGSIEYTSGFDPADIIK